jgi:hypothetical protein
MDSTEGRPQRPAWVRWAIRDEHTREKTGRNLKLLSGAAVLVLLMTVLGMKGATLPSWAGFVVAGLVAIDCFWRAAAMRWIDKHHSWPLGPSH